MGFDPRPYDHDAFRADHYSTDEKLREAQECILCLVFYLASVYLIRCREEVDQGHGDRRSIPGETRGLSRDASRPAQRIQISAHGSSSSSCCCTFT